MRRMGRKPGVSPHGRQSTYIDVSPDEASLKQAQQEYIFLQLVSVFVGAVRCGILEVEHAKEPLAHYGRFGPTYDAVVKKLIDVLRDEGIYNKDAVTVQHVAGSALQAVSQLVIRGSALKIRQSFTIFLDSEAEDPTATIALAKVIASAFVIHGTHFSVLRQIHPSDVYDFHISSSDYITHQIANFVKLEKSQRSKEARSRSVKKRYQALSFFRALALLLGPVTGKDAVRIKRYLEEAMLKTDVQMSVHKGWDAYRMYERRLVLISSKDPSVKMASKRVAAEAEDGDSPVPVPPTKNHQPVVEDDNEEDEGEGESSPTPAATNRKSARQSVVEQASEKEDNEGEDPAHLREESLSSPPTTPAKRPLNPHDESVSEPLADVDFNRDLDVDLDLSPSSQDTGRARSVSIEPMAKKRKMVKRF